MYNVATLDLKLNNNKITDSTVLTFCIEMLLENKDNTKEENIKLIKIICREYIDYLKDEEFKQWVNNDELTSYNKTNYNLLNAISPIAWVSNNYEDINNYCDSIVSLLTTKDEEYFQNKIVIYLLFCLKKKQDPKVIEQLINENGANDEIKNSYKIFKDTRDYVDALNKNIEAINNNEVKTNLISTLAYAYYKYIPNELVKEAINYLPNTKNYSINRVFISITDIIEYLAVISEYVFPISIFIGNKYYSKGKEVLRLYHAENIKTIEMFLLNELTKNMILNTEDAFPETYAGVRDYDNYIEHQKYYYNLTNDLTELLDEVKSIFNSLQTVDNIEQLNIIVTKINKIFNKLEYNEEYILFKNPEEVNEYIYKEFDSKDDIYNNLIEVWKKVD